MRRARSFVRVDGRFEHDHVPGGMIDHLPDESLPDLLPAPFRLHIDAPHHALVAGFHAVMDGEPRHADKVPIGEGAEDGVRSGGGDPGADRLDR